MKKNILIAHGGGPTPVINASLAGVISRAKSSDRVEKIYTAAFGVEGLLQENIIDVSDINSDDISRLKNTPSSAIGSCRYKVGEKDYEKIKKVFEEYGIDVFFYNGGNDSMDTCLILSNLLDNTQIIGIPKTIDNDLAVIDHSPGYGSAAKFAAMAVKELGLDLRALPIHVSIIELMGRNTGWITAASLLARQDKDDAPHLVYLPEDPFIEEEFLEQVQKAYKHYGGVVVAVSEGLKDEAGNNIVKPKHATDMDGFNHPLPGNISQHLSELVTGRLGIRSRSEKPGLLGRSSLTINSMTDRKEAYDVGNYAMELALKDMTGVMAGFKRLGNNPYTIEMCPIGLSEVANVEKIFPKEWIHSKKEFDSAFYEYVQPLIGDDIPNAFRLSLPQLMRS